MGLKPSLGAVRPLPKLHQKSKRVFIKSHGMGNSIINWIEQWLTDRRQRVVVDGEVYSWKSVLSGVPKRSVLGPILFLVYINTNTHTNTNTFIPRNYTKVKK